MPKGGKESEPLISITTTLALPWYALMRMKVRICVIIVVEFHGVTSEIQYNFGPNKHPQMKSFKTFSLSAI